MKVLGIDIGGSGIKGAPVDTDTGQLLAERLRIETPEGAPIAGVSDAVAQIARHFSWEGPIGVGFPGVMRRNVAHTAANLGEPWIGRDLAKLFGKATRCPVTAINDADAAGLAEMRFGAGQGEEDVVLMITLGTGIGSGLFHRGRLIPNTELGHLPLKGDSAEKWVAGSVRKRKGLTWEEWGGRLDRYLDILETILWPDLIILGGGISEKFRKFSPYLRRRSKIVPARMLNDAGIVGAALGVIDCAENPRRAPSTGRVRG